MCDQNEWPEKAERVRHSQEAGGHASRSVSERTGGRWTSSLRTGMPLQLGTGVGRGSEFLDGKKDSNMKMYYLYYFGEIIVIAA